MCSSIAEGSPKLVTLITDTSMVFLSNAFHSAMPKQFAIAAMLLLSSLMLAQGGQTSQVDVVAGREFLGKLEFDPSADAVLFSKLPIGEPEKLLMALVDYDQRYDAGLSDWRELHKALEGVIEIHLYRGQSDMAAVRADLQAAMYRMHEEDYLSSLEAERRALTIAQSSPSRLDLSAFWMKIGQDLYRLGRNDEALEAMRKAQGLMKAQGGMVAGTLWRNIVQVELALGDRGAAKQEVTKFAAASKEPYASTSFRVLAILAASDVQESDSDYDGALDSAREAVQVANSDPEAKDTAFAIAGRVVECVIAASTELPHKNAVALARRIESEFPDLPIPSRSCRAKRSPMHRSARIRPLLAS